MLGSHYDNRAATPANGTARSDCSPRSPACRSQQARARLPFAVEVVGFADEEGVRFASTLLGSRAVAGTFVESALIPRPCRISMREALVQFGLDPSISAGGAAPRELLAYVELHIEQGPVLEQQNLAVGVVTGDRGRHTVGAKLTGMAATPARYRWRCAAMRWRALPNAFAWWKNSARPTKAGSSAPSAISTRCPAPPCDPRMVSLRSTSARRPIRNRKMAVADIVRRIEAIAKRRNLALQLDVTTKPHRALRALAEGAVAESRAAEGYGVFELPSGAGHDGMARSISPTSR